MNLHRWLTANPHLRVVSGDALHHRIRSLADRSKRYSERHFKLLGLIVVVTIPLSTFIERAVGDPAFNTLYIRLLAGCAGLPLLFHDRLPSLFQRNLELVWIAVATFVLPFSYGVILALNAAYTPPGAVSSPIWVYQYLVALFIFIQLINHGPLSVLLWAIATSAVFLLCAGLDQPNLNALREAWLYPLPVYLSALIVGSITNRNVHVVQSEQIRAASAIGTNIAHEVRTPLASIGSLARSIRKFLPALVDGYEKARRSGYSLEPLTDYQLQQLRKGLESIRAEVNHANTAINILLMNTLEKPASADGFQSFRISEAIEEAVHRFPFNNSREKALLTCEISPDFSVHGPKLLIVHVLFNLIKNGLYFAQREGLQGTLLISTGSYRGNNIVDVTDTGAGVPPNLKPRIFDRFFSSDNTSQGAGIGLSFCKMVMESIGGEIQCESREGEYTTFRLLFPPPASPPPAPEPHSGLAGQRQS